MLNDTSVKDELRTPCKWTLTIESTNVPLRHCIKGLISMDAKLMPNSFEVVLRVSTMTMLPTKSNDGTMESVKIDEIDASFMERFVFKIGST